MIELLLVPAAGLTVALFGEKFKSKNDDKRKIQVFFEVAGIAIKRNNEDKLQYPKFQKQIDDDRSTTYVYTLPLGMPSKIIQKVEDVVSEGLNKPVRIQYDNYKLNIRVFRREIPKNWSWSMDLVTKGKWRIPVGQSLETIAYHDFDETPHMAVGGLIRMGKTVFLKNMFASLSLANDQSGLEQLPSIPGRAIYMKESFTVLQVPYIDDIVMWKHLKEYEVEKHEHPEPYENQPSDGDTCDD
ncbi:hypothetical protein [Bacillus paranthracis]|uniref:hypothetical protein n=1 Tax=Bacillus paranthracis TaxID=2026186 RepID=UPI00224F3E15|nr:hypothetical protein [Bacillus paranthracis]MCX3317984.1 hypothetical protein [Bacillus paranthracis]MDR0167411.1 hypothetical protein [Bacillus paranthracis]